MPTEDAADADDVTNKQGVGLWIQLNTDTWHRSVEFNGHRHDLACETSVYVASDEPLQDLERDLSRQPQGGRLCRECLEFWEGERDE